MSEPAISVDQLGKRYRRGSLRRANENLRETLASGASHLRRRITGVAQPKHDSRRSQDDFWALRDVSFDIAPGEIVGLIGSNGAGKSTLLKLLSRITEPTEGEVRVRGRVGSLLEVGTGFHPELTGRENVMLSGAILGMKRREVLEKFDEIVDFSEVASFIDTPVKHYSSGMYLRLAFAVAAHLEPEILLVDEVLAVGDARFQKKCLGKMGDVASHGRTIVMVSHNMTAIQSLCRRVLWLGDGRLLMDDRAEETIGRYLASSVDVVTERVWEDGSAAPGSDVVRLRAARVRCAEGAPEDSITTRTPLMLEFEYENLRPGADLNLSLHLYDEKGNMVFNTMSIHDPRWQGQVFPAGVFRSICVVPGDLLNDGLHRVELLVVRDQSTAVCRVSDLLVFDVQDERLPGLVWYGKWPGAVRPLLDWRTEQLSEAPQQTQPQT